MGRFWMKFSIPLAVVLMIQTTTAASNLKWVGASGGKLPAYAVAAGEDYPGETLYVARIRLGSGLTPGKMEVSSKKGYASWGGKEYSNVNYEVLTNPGWRSHLEWKKSSGGKPPANAVVGGADKGRTLYVGRFLYSDGHMIPGKVAYFTRKAYVPYGAKEYYKSEWWVLVEHAGSGRKRGFSPDLPGVTPLKRTPILEERSEKRG